MDIMKILAELYLNQLGIEANIETVPLVNEDKEKAVSEKIA